MKEYFGYLFTPQNKDEKIYGKLIISKDLIVFEYHSHYFKNDTFPVLNGVFNGLDKATFLQVHVSYSTHGRGTYAGRLKIKNVIKDLHYDVYNDIGFNEVYIKSCTLTDIFISKNPLNRNKEISENNRVKHFESEYKDFLITLKSNVNKLHISRNELSTLFYTYFCIKSKFVGQVVSLKDLNLISKKIKNWLLLTTQENPEFESIRFKDIVEDIYEHELCFTSKDLNPKNFAQSISPDLYFIEKFWSFEEYLKKFFTQEKLTNTLDLIFEWHYSEKMYWTSYFLNICVASDRIFGILYPTNKTILIPGIKERTDFRKKISSLLDDSNEKNLFNQSTTDWKKPTYREKLTFYPYLKELMISHNLDIEITISLIIKNRNSLAHDGTVKNTTDTMLLYLGKLLEFNILIEIFEKLEAPEKIIEKLKLDAKNTSLMFKNNLVEDQILSISLHP